MAERPVFGTPLPDASTPTAEEVRQAMAAYRQAMEATDMAAAELEDSLEECADYLMRDEDVPWLSRHRRERAMENGERAREAEQTAGRAALRAWEVTSG